MFTLKVSIIIPSKDKNGVELNHDTLLKKVLVDIIKMCGGAYIESKNNQGGFLMQDGTIMLECSSIVTTYTKQEIFDSEAFSKYLYELKKETNQEALAYVVNNSMYLI